MSFGIRLFFALCVLAAASFGDRFEEALKIDGPDGRRFFQEATRELIVEGNHGELERLSAEIRREGAEHAEGLSQLDSFYRTFEYYRGDPAPLDYKKLVALLREWEKARPDSVTPLVASAWMQIGIADSWKRKGYPESDDAAKRNEYEKRVRLAEGLLRNAELRSRGQADCPSWYAARMAVARHQRWDRERFDECFGAAVEKYPDFECVYFGKLYYVMAVEADGPAEVGRYLDWIWRSGRKEMYARVAWVLSDWKGLRPAIAKYGADWGRMKVGFEAMFAACPGSQWNLYTAFKYGRARGDRAFCRRLLDERGLVFERLFWLSQEEFAEAVGWAGGAGA